MKTVHIIVSGRVQGIFFRAHTKEVAEKLGVKGYAKNLSDGNVEVVAQGDDEKLKELIKFCRKGPRAADVTDIDVKYMDSNEKFDDFSIKY